MSSWEEVDWRRGTVEWPARSPDLNPLVFFSIGPPEDSSFQNTSGKYEPTSGNDLKRTQRDYSKNVPHCQSFIQRFYYCQAVEGIHLNIAFSECKSHCISLVSNQIT